MGCTSAHKGMTLDFWDLVRVLFRRWQISLPMLVLSIAFTGLIFTHVKPNYVASAVVQLVPPLPQAPPKPTDPQPVRRNPWLVQDLSTLGNAALVSVMDVGYVESLKAAGYTDAYTATMTEGAPQVTFQVTGKSAAQATGTAEKLVQRYDQSVLYLQTSSGVADQDLIKPRRLDAGSNVTKSSSNVKRAVAAVGVVGLLMTIAVTIAVDAWLRRRRRAAMAGAEVSASVSAAAPPLPEPDATTLLVPDAPPMRRPDQPTTTLSMTRVPSATTNGTPGHKPPPAKRAQPKDASAPEPDYDVPHDATVVLPKASPALND